MSDLIALRDHARVMARGGPKLPERKGYWCSPIYAEFPEHSRCSGCGCSCHPRIEVSDADRELWTRIADEIDEYLTLSDDGQGELL